MDDATFAALVRSYLYAVLARGFSPPARTVAGWRAQSREIPDLAAAVECMPGGSGLAAPLRALEEARTSIATEEDLEHLRDTAMELFGNFRSQGFPPYETEYTAGGDFRQGHELADLMGFYRAFGLDLRPPEAQSERPDHIAVELEFLHFICWKEARARQAANAEHVEVCIEVEQKFLREHLGRWAEVFARGVERSAPGSFFAALAALLRVLVTQDAATLEIKLDPVQVPAPRSRPEEPLTCGGESPQPLVQIQGGK